jgi:cobalt-zinc-cadmium efflux system outer membrane protein
MLAERWWRAWCAPVCGLLLVGCGGTDALFAPTNSAGQVSAAGEVRQVSPGAGDRTDRRSEYVQIDLDQDPELGDYLRYAALNNPGLEAAFQRWRAAVERVPGAAALPDPRFTYGYFIGEIETRVGPMQHQIALSQTFPWFGELSDREDAAARDANAAYRRFEAARLELFYRVTDQYVELWHLARSLEVTEANVELLRQVEQIALAKFRVAGVSHPDVLRIQVEIGRLEDRRIRLEQLRPVRVAALNAVLNREPDAPVPWPETLPEPGWELDEDALADRLARANPTLLALDEEIERERSNAAAARKDGLPDFTLGLAYTVIGDRGELISENGDDALLATVSVNVPLWREKYDAQVREALARRLAAAGARQDAENALEAELSRRVFELEDADRRESLYRDTLMPRAEEALTSTLAAFRTGTAGILEVLDVERTLLEFQLSLERSRADRAVAYAGLGRLLGGSVMTGGIDDIEEVSP